MLYFQWVKTLSCLRLPVTAVAAGLAAVADASLCHVQLLRTLAAAATLSFTACRYNFVLLHIIEHSPCLLLYQFACFGYHTSYGIRSRSYIVQAMGLGNPGRSPFTLRLPNNVNPERKFSSSQLPVHVPRLRSSSPPHNIRFATLLLLLRVRVDGPLPHTIRPRSIESQEAVSRTPLLLKEVTEPGS